MSGRPAIRLEGIRVRLGGREVLRLGALAFRRGERVAIIGSSGAGKTTLLRLLKGHIAPSEGSVEVLGERLPIPRRWGMRAHHRRIGMIHQHFDLVGRETVWRNVYHGRLGHIPLRRSLFGVCTPGDRAVCERAIGEVGLSDKAARRARTLSGGERQRVAIARALAQEPAVFLADEPVSSLDPALAGSLLGLLVSLSAAHRLTLLMNLHLPELARRFAERIVALRGGEVVWDGPAAALSPERVREIYGRANLPGGRNVQPAASGGLPSP